MEKNSKSLKRFVSTNWYKNINEGGGTYKILKDGNIFDKVGVNKSTASGHSQKNSEKYSWS